MFCQHVLFPPKCRCQRRRCRFHLRVLVGRRDGPVNVDHQSGVVGRVGTREGDLVGRVGVAAAGDGDLGASNVKLSLAWSRVQSNVFDPEEVVSAGDARRQRDLSLVQVLMCDGTLVSLPLRGPVTVCSM